MATHHVSYDVRVRKAIERWENEGGRIVRKVQPDPQPSRSPTKRKHVALTRRRRRIPTNH